MNSVPVLELDNDEPAEDTSPDVMVPQDVPANPEDKAPEHLPDILAPVGNGRNGAEQRQNNE